MRKLILTIVLLVLALPAPAFAQPAADFTPDASKFVRWGKGYRYPQSGWIVVHIEGEPYERGYQHGRLLGSGDRRPCALLRPDPQLQGPQRRLENRPHVCQRPFPAQVRQGISGRNEGHRRRRSGGRGSLRRPARRSGRYRRPQLLGRDRHALERGQRRHADGPGNADLPRPAAASQADAATASIAAPLPPPARPPPTARSSSATSPC